MSQEIHLPYNWAPRDYQEPLWEAMERGTKRAMLFWHRRAGKDLCMINLIACKSMTRVGAYWHIFPTYKQGKKSMWEGKTKDGRRFMDYFPPPLIERRREQDLTIDFINGSQYVVVGADNPDSQVGTNPVGMVFSEWALMDPSIWTYLLPILSENDGWAIFVTTPRGRNHAYRMYMNNKDNPKWFCELLGYKQTKAISEESVEEAIKEGMMSEDKAAQEFDCFPEGTLVHTSRGQKAIESVVSGDFVLTHAGRFRPVLETMSREYSGEIVEIESYGEVGRPLRCTPEHPVRCYDPGSQSYAWIPACDVKCGMFVVMPRLKQACAFVPEHVAALIAWYIAEGSVQKTAVAFSFHEDESEYIEEVLACGRQMHANAFVYPAATGAKAVSVVAQSSRLADFLAESCGTGAHAKRIPWGLISGHERVVFERLMAGDGCLAQTRGYEFWSYTTVSHDLARDVQLLASTLGMRAGITRRPASSSWIDGRLVRGGPSYSVQIREERPTKGARIRPGKHGTGAYVRSVRHEPGPKRVFNLSVKFDESYVAEGRVVHNCSFDAALEHAYFGKEMREAAEEGRIGLFPYDPRFPVETWWDIGVTDYTAIWFVQRQFGANRFIRFYKNVKFGLPHYLAKLAGLQTEFGYIYREHLLPHDAEVMEWGTGVTRVERFQTAGYKNVRVVPKIGIYDGIEAVRAMLAVSYFHEADCENGLEALRQYSRKPLPGQTDDTGKQMYGQEPLHDWASHGADAIRTGAVGARRVMPNDREGGALFSPVAMV